MDKINRYTAIPAAILQQIEEAGLSKIMRDRSVKFVTLLINKGMQENFNLDKFIELPKNYLKKAFGHRYKTDFMNELTDRKIVEVNHEYRPMYGNGKSKSYRISQEFLGSSWVPTSFSDSSSSSSSSFLHVCGAVFEKSVLFDDLKQLSIDGKKLWQATQERINKVNVSQFKVDDEVTANWMEVHIEGQTRNLTRNEALHFVKQEGLSLIQDGGEFHIDDLDRYVERKKQHILINYRYTLAKLEKGIWFANRNTTNNRLDHNLTSMCSHLLDIIKEDNGLTEIDLNNSQFAILSYLMQQQGIDTEDAKLFYRLSANGQLYSFVQQALGLEAKKQGKQTMFELCFSSHRNNTGNKKALREMFPTVVNFIDDYKKNAKHYGEFAIWLQKTESEIFIDGLYHELKQKGTWVVTKHDSLLVNKEDEAKVRKYVENKFKKMKFECTLG